MINDLCLSHPASALWICSYLTTKEQVCLGLSEKNLYKNLYPMLKPVFDSFLYFTKCAEELQVLQAAEDYRIQSGLFDLKLSLTVFRPDQRLADINSETLIALHWKEYNVNQLTQNYLPRFIEYSEAKKYSYEKIELTLIRIILGVNTNNAALRSAAADKKNQIDGSRFRLLCKHSTNIDETSSNGNTALHWALKFGNDFFALILLENGANCNVANNRGERPLHFAALHSSDDLVRKLLEKKAYLHAWDNQRETALDWATKKNKVACVKYLSSLNK